MMAFFLKAKKCVPLKIPKTLTSDQTIASNRRSLSLCAFIFRIHFQDCILAITLNVNQTCLVDLFHMKCVHH